MMLLTATAAIQQLIYHTERHWVYIYITFMSHGYGQLCSEHSQLYPEWHFCLQSFHFGMTEPNLGIKKKTQ